MEVISLQSGSSGNCIYVETDGVRLLFDAGISGRAAETRLAEHGKDIRDCDALIISHDHRDHICAMGTFHRKFGLPVYVTRRTFDAARNRIKIGKLSDIRHFVAGETLRFGNVLKSKHSPHPTTPPMALSSSWMTPATALDCLPTSATSSTGSATQWRHSTASSSKATTIPGCCETGRIPSS